MDIFYSTLEQALLFFPLVLGMHLSYRILKITDLTVDGTYVLGAAVFARMLEQGILPALILSTAAGAFIGSLVAYMQINNRINDLVAGVLASFMLYSVNLQVLGRPNISILGKNTILSFTNFTSWVFPLLILAFILITGLIILLKSELGLKLRAFGHNQKLLKILGKNVEKYRLLGLALSNAFAALTGAVAVQMNGFADINMGFGIALVGIGAVVIGRQVLIPRQDHFFVFREVISCFIGIFVYFLCLGILLRMGVNPANLKFILGLVLFFTLRSI